MPYRTVAKLGDLAAGDIMPIDVDGVKLILFRVGDDYFAAQRYCLHQRADLAEGEIQQGFLVCRQHGWRFHARTGVHELSPQTCLRTYAVRVEGEHIQIDPKPMWQGEMIP